MPLIFCMAGFPELLKDSSKFDVFANIDSPQNDESHLPPAQTNGI